MDQIDLKILDCLQQDASLSAAEIADRVNLSKTPCWRRIQKLEKSGVIAKKVVLLNRENSIAIWMYLSRSAPINTMTIGFRSFPRS